MTKGYSRVDLEYVSDHHPIDGLAARVTQTGEHYDINVASHQYHSKNPEITRKAKKGDILNPCFEDLTGISFGRFTVVGMSKIRTRGKANWSIRCVCGNYEHMKAKTIKAYVIGIHDGEDEPMCSWCQNTRKLRDNLRK